ncbi:hypothetical protein IFM89_008149 [Coptis chinensis]|uniref:Uncharacterized protein n=1 Tax=Coptis chinensis TaxID=261450 RepID=A0A835IU95_9MAGN|nr:hypothetical protein IFM89_008149 [Coptis chinensis]
MAATVLDLYITTFALAVSQIDFISALSLSASILEGREAVETMTAVGPGLTGRSVGDVVAYGGNPMGSYTEEQILPASVVVSVPSSIDPIVGASVMLKGMAAWFLLRQCFKVCL